MTLHPLRLIVIAAFALSVSACSADEYQPPDPGHLKNPGFGDEAGSDALGAPWSLTQHAGESAYRAKVSDGVLTLEKFAKQQWGQVYQIVPAEPLRGKTVEFSAELSADLKETELAPGKWPLATGVGVIVKGFRDNPSLRALGKTNLLIERNEPTPPLGKSDWQRYKVEFQVPETATDIQLEIQLLHEGVLHARGPRLVVVKGEDG